MNFALGEFFVVGALLFITVQQRGLPFPIAFLISLLVIVICAFFIERVLLRRALRQAPIIAAAATFGLAMSSAGAAKLIWGTYPLYSSPFTGVKPLQIFNVTIDPQTFWIWGITAIILCLLLMFFRRTAIGKAMRGCAENTDAALIVGINVKRMRLLSFILAGVAGAIAGIIISPLIFVTYDMGLSIAIKGFVACIIGGMGNILGAFLGALILGLFEALIGGLISTTFRDAGVYTLLILLLVFKPQGIFGGSRVE